MVRAHGAWKGRHRRPASAALAALRSPAGLTAGTDRKGNTPRHPLPAVSIDTRAPVLPSRWRRSVNTPSLRRLARRGFRGLWRSPDFRRLWVSLTVTAFGAQVTNLALPLTA